MKDYSSMSDFDIQQSVLQETWGKHPVRLLGKMMLDIMLSDYDPCNNPADAWPIIISNRISLMFDASTEEGNEAEWCLASSPCDQIIVDHVTPDKMLRSAMIVYLQMMEQKS